MTGGAVTVNDTAMVCGEFVAPVEESETVARYVPAPSAPSDGWTDTVYGPAPPTVAASQPEPEPYATFASGAASVPPPRFETVTVCAAGLDAPAAATNESDVAES